MLAKEAGRPEQIRQLLFDFEWLQRKLEATDVQRYCQIMIIWRMNEELGPRAIDHQAFGSCASTRQHQLPGQLIGRLFGNDSANIQALLKQASGWNAWPWLRL